MAKDIFERTVMHSIALKLKGKGVKVDFYVNEESSHPYLIEYNGDMYEFKNQSEAMGFIFGLDAAHKKDRKEF